MSKIKSNVMSLRRFNHLSQSQIVDRGEFHLKEGDELIKQICYLTGIDFQLNNVEEIIRYRWSRNLEITQYNEHLYKFRGYKWINKKTANLILEIDAAKLKIVIGYHKPTMNRMKFHIIDWDENYVNMCYLASEFINNL